MAEKSVQIYCFVGYFARRSHAVNRIKEKHDPNETLVFDANSPIELVIEKFGTHSCFESHRLVVLNDWPAASNRTAAVTKLSKALNKLPNDVTVVLNGLESRAKAFTEVIKKKGETKFWPQKLSQYDAVEYVIDAANKKEKSVEREDIQLLIDSICPTYGREREIDADKLYLLVKKLMWLVGGRKNIKKEDILAVAVDQTVFIVWQLHEYIDQGKYAESMRLVYKAVGEAATASAEFEVLMGILRTLLWRYKLLLLIKGLAMDQKSPDLVVDELQKLSKVKKDKTFGRLARYAIEPDEKGNSQPIYSRKAIEFAMIGYGSKPAISYYSLWDLMSIFRAVNKASLKIRSTPNIGECLLCMDSVLLTACRKFPESRTEFIREEYLY